MFSDASRELTSTITTSAAIQRAVPTTLTSANKEVEEKEESRVWSCDAYHEERNGGKSDGAGLAVCTFLTQ
jgi:hypothetical protein